MNGDMAMTRHRHSAFPGELAFPLVLALPCLLLGWGCKRSSNETPSDEAPMTITLSSKAFPAGATIPKQHTGDGADRSPPLTWSEPPAGTKSLALICEDPDAPGGTWVHWVLFNLPAQTRELEEAHG
jgi:phosphatidylethanolamine-binding protein (PEBP) family uncharacterized protein